MTGRTILVLAAAALTVTALAACSSSGTSSPAKHQPSQGASSQGAPSRAGTAQAGTAQAEVGELTITGGFIPQQASPDVAAAYLTITNNGSTADTLSKVTTSVTRDVMAMDETDHGTSGAMTELPQVVVPAHGSFAFTQSHAHLMLQRPTHLLKQGDKVSMTITFAHAGTVRLVLPVVGFTGPSEAMSTPAMNDMSAMSDVH